MWGCAVKGEEHKRPPFVPPPGSQDRRGCVEDATMEREAYPDTLGLVEILPESQANRKRPGRLILSHHQALVGQRSRIQEPNHRSEIRRAAMPSEEEEEAEAAAAQAAAEAEAAAAEAARMRP